MSDRETRRAWVILQTVFVASGAAALGYEIVWGRWLATVLGASTLAASVVLSCYMGGLAAGAWFFGRFSAKTSNPLRIYALVEALIAVCAVIFPLLADVTFGLSPALRVVVAVLILLAPTFLMGGTLPLVIAWSEQRALPEGATLGRLYGLNTLGAALGSLVAGFVLIPGIGLEGSNAVAAAINIFIALVAFVMSRGDEGAPDAEPEEEAATSAGAPAYDLLALAFLSGLVTLGLEVLWIRQLRILLGSTTYTFTLVIAIFIMGLGVGGLFAARFPEERAEAPTLFRGQGALLLLLSLQFALLPSVPGWLEAWQARSLTFEATLGYTVVLSVILLLPLTLVIGYLFPLLGRLFMRRGHRGQEVGRLYTVNTLGSVIGALAVTFVLVPTVGSANAFAIFMVLMVVSLGLYARLAGESWSKGARRSQLALGGLAGLVALALGATKPGWTPRNIAFGVGWTTNKEGSEIILFREGRGSTVVVEEHAGGRTIRIDGKPVASTLFNDRVNELLLGHLPAVLATEMNKGVVIGLGSGITTGALSLHRPKLLRQVEIEPEVVNGAALFGEHNFHVVENPSFSLVVDDGFNHLSATDEHFDVITSDPIQPYFRGAATLYSVDYFRLAHDRLTEAGAMAHWLPLGNLSPTDFTMTVRSFCEAFPHARLYWAGGGTDGILVGRRTPFPPGDVVPAHWASAKDSMYPVYVESAEEAGSLLIAERDGLMAWAGEGPVNTIDHPRLEFTAPKSQYANTFGSSYFELIRLRQTRPLARAVDAATFLVLTYKWQRETSGEAMADRLLIENLPCGGDIASCGLVKVSGLLRRLLYRRSLQMGDAELNRFNAYRGARRGWPTTGKPLPCSGPEVEAAEKHYARARALANRPEEKRRLELRLRQLEQQAPDCVETLRTALSP